MTTELNELALFAGGGGGILGGRLLGWRTRCAVELAAYARRSLLARQRDGAIERFPIWDDVETFDGVPWRGWVDIITAGFPCQDISSANPNAEGIEGERSGLFKEVVRLIREVGPRFVLLENSPMLTVRGLGVVLGELASLGYDARWGVLSAADAIWSFSPPCLDHLRERIWIVARSHSESLRCGESGLPIGTLAEVTDANFGHQAPADSPSERWREAWKLRYGESEERTTGRNQTPPDSSSVGRRQVELENLRGTGGERAIDSLAEPAWSWWATEPDVDRVVHGLANRVDRLRAVGNGQVPAVVQLAWHILSFNPNE